MQYEPRGEKTGRDVLGRMRAEIFPEIFLIYILNFRDRLGTIIVLTKFCQSYPI